MNSLLRSKNLKYIVVLLVILVLHSILVFQLVEQILLPDTFIKKYDIDISHVRVIYFLSLIFRVICLLLLLKLVFRLVPLLSPLVLVELVFTIIPVSLVTPSYQMLNWQTYFSMPTNELDYRDYEITDWSKENKLNKILVLGDSYTAGNGIANINNRYDKKLELALNRRDNTYSARIAAKPGWGTRSQFNALKEFPVQPDQVVLQFYINDVHDFVKETSAVKDDPYLNEYAAQFPFPGKLSYTSNFLYGITIQKWFDYNKLIKEKGIVIDSRVISDYFKEVEDIILFCNERNIKLSILIIPDLTTLYVDRNILGGFETLSAVYHISIVNPTERLRALSLDERVVSMFDVHASSMSHEIISEEIYKLLSQGKS